MNKKEVLHDFCPHYSNKYYKTARVIWGMAEIGLSWDYSDRFIFWDAKKHDVALDIASSKASRRTPQWVEEYLTAFFEKPIEIVCIMAGFNVSNGFPYQVFGYKEK